MWHQRSHRLSPDSRRENYGVEPWPRTTPTAPSAEQSRLLGPLAARCGAPAVPRDATLINVHSEKEQAAPTFKRGFGYHPLCAFLDHGQAGTGEPLAIHLRPGNAGSNTASDHISVTREALAQLPSGLLSAGGRGSKKVLIRTDGAGGTKDFLEWLTTRRLAYSVGFSLPAHTSTLMLILAVE